LRLTHFRAFRPCCPVCAAAGRPDRTLRLAQTFARTDEEIVSGMLHCPDPSCLHEYPILDRVPVIVPDLRRVLSARAAEILLRTDLDPAQESLLGDALGPENWFDTLRQTVSTYAWDAFADLDPQEFSGEPPRPGAARRCLERLLALAAPLPETRMPETGLVVDLGCAAGRTSFALADLMPDSLVLGIDLGIALLRLAQAAAQGGVSYSRRRTGLVYDRRSFAVSLAGAERTDFWACDALALPFAPGIASVVVALNLLDCVDDPRGLLAAVAALLRAGGRLLLATPFDWSSRATPVERWIGGHSQRADHGGAAESFLRTLVTEGAHPQSVRGLRIVGEADFPWQTRLHDRGAVSYRTFLMALDRCGG